MIQELENLDPGISLDARSSADPVVLCAADQNYIHPLTVMLHSAAASLGDGNLLHVLLIDGGIQTEGWAGLHQSLAELPISVNVIRPDLSQVSDLGISHHITHTAYLRLLAARLLPDSIDKVIYLDSDVLVKQDLSELWKVDVGNAYCAAATDIACPFIDARVADRRFKAALPYLATLSPIRNWQRLGLTGSDRYFNSGVMILNLRRWREERIEQSLLRCLRENKHYVWCWDQYALNVVFAGQWKSLSARWNQGVHVFEYPDESYSPIEVSEFIRMRDDPAIIHFTTEFKPWRYRPYHPLRNEYYDCLDRTCWAGWRPEKPSFSLRKWWDWQAIRVIRSTTVGYRKMAILLQ